MTLVKPNPQKVEQEYQVKINEITSIVSKTVEEINEKYNEKFDTVEGNEQEAIAKLQQDLNSKAEECDNIVNAKAQEVVDAEAKVEELKAALKQAEKVLKSTKGSFKYEDKAQKKVKSKLAADFKNAAADVREKSVEETIALASQKDKEVDAEQQKVEKVTAESAEAVAKEKAALRDYVRYVKQVARERVVNGIKAVFNTISTVYQQAHDQDPNVEVPASLKKYEQKPAA